MSKKTVLTGITTTGTPHLGNYVGAIRPAIEASKNPEILILLNGTCTFNWKHIDDTEIKTEQYTGPVHFEIPPYIWHELIPDTDCTFIELNSIAEHAADTFRL